MQKRGKIGLSAVGILLLFLIFSFYFVVAGENNKWVIEGNRVYVDNNDVYISAQPHTIKERGYVYFNITSKQYEGDVDVIFGFNTPLLKPTKAELYKPEWKNRTESYTCLEYFNYTLNPKHAWCYRNKTNKNNETIDELELIYEHSFEWGNLNEKTIYWNESYLDEWKDISQAFSSINYEHGGMNKWYYIKDIPIEKNKNYLIRGFIEIPRGKGFSPINLDEKYWFAIKPSSETLQQAITNNHLYALDPWINSSGANQNKDYLSNNLIAYWKMENQSEEINSSYYNLTAFNPASGSPTFDTGIIGLGSVFNGSWNVGWNTTKYNDDLNFNQTGANFTISFWTKEASSDTQSFFTRIIPPSDIGWCIMLINGKVRWYDISQNEVYAANALNLNTWQYVAIIRNSSNLCIFVNGTQENCSARGDDINGTGLTLIMGVYHPAGNYPLNGMTDEIGIWKRALNVSEISDLYNNGKGITYLPPDAIHPIWKDNWTSATNKTKKGDLVYFNVTLEDNVEGGYYILSFDDGTGNFVNDTPVSWTTPQEINITKTITAIRNQEVKWKWYFSDLAGNKNETPIWSFIVANTPPNQTQPMLTSPSGKNLSTENLTCYNQSTNDADNDTITNIYNWYKNSQPLAVLNLPLEINANDYSNNNNHGTISGTTFELGKTSGKVGNALNFDGFDDYILIPDSTSLDFTNKKTWQLWFKRNSLGEETLFDKSSEGKSNYKLEFLSNNLLKFSYSLVSSWVSELWQFDFSEGTYNQTYYNETENAVMLDNNYEGDYTSEMFNDSGKTLSFKTISFSADVPKTKELSPETGMVALWHMNENSGNITYDATSNNNNGTIYGASWAEGKFNSALSFDGTNDGIKVLDSDILSFGDGANDHAFTISAWIYLLSTGGVKSILMKDGASGYKEFQFYVSNGVLTAYLFNLGGTSYIGKYYTTALNAGQWYQVTIAYNGNKSSSGISLYLNGNKVSDSVSQSGTYIAMNNTKSNVTIGMHPSSSWYFNGTIDEVSIWNRSLTDSEILDNYNKGTEAITNLSLSVRSCSNNDCSDKANNWDIVDKTSSPIDISSLNNNTYFQFKADFSTNDTAYSPKLYNVTLNYSKQTLETEANITSITAITNDNQWHLVTITFNEPGANNLKLYINDTLDAQKTETGQPYYTNNNLTIAKFFNGSIDEFRIYDYALSQEQISNNHLLKYNTIVSQETSGGDNWMCQVTPNDGEEDGTTLNSTSLSVLWSIEFDVRDSYSNVSIDDVTISCNYSEFDQAGDTTNLYGPYGFEPGSWECNFITITGYYDKTQIFSADNDKTVYIKLSEKFSLTYEEHTWLEAIYNCIILGDCSLYNLLIQMNQTIGNIWEHTKPTDQSVIIFENITNKTVDSTHNLTINYTVNIPIKAGYVFGTYLPVRIGFWFLDVSNITCYNQGSKPVGVEDPYCQPLVIETIGPMGGSVSFIVKLHPSLPAGSYSIKRMIDIDPNRIWINYGQETIGMISLTEPLNNPEISLEKTGETMPSSGSAPSSSGGSGRGGGGGSSITNINIYNVTNVVKENKENEREKKSEANEEELEGAAGITGAIIGAGEQLMSGGHLVAIIAIIGGVLVVLIISRTIIRLKKKVTNLFFLFFLIIILLNSVSATQTYLNESEQWMENLSRGALTALAWGDLDDDGDLDLILTKEGPLANDLSAKIYINNGTSLVENPTWQNNLTTVNYGSLALGDIDNDGDLDLALSGCGGGADFVDACDKGAIRTFIYINNGTTFTESSQWGNNLTAVYRPGSLTFGDIDNDGDLDLLLNGQTESSITSKVYINNGTTLTESSQWQSNLTALRKASLVLGDYDNDDDLDLIISGRDNSDNKLTKAYLNNKTSFIESSQWQQNLLNVEDSSLAFADFDNDGYLDLSLTGCCDNHRIYRNNGTSFVEMQREGQGLAGVFAGSQAFGDYDTDGYLDITTNGREEATVLYLYNVSISNFTRGIYDPESHINDLIYGSVAWIDLDADSDLDLIEVGYGDSTGRAYVYLSNRSLTKNNTKPVPPTTGFSSSYVNNVFTLSWGNGSDAETNASGLCYNLRVGNSTNNHTIVSGVYGGSSNPTAGYFGNMMQRKSISLNVQLEANKTYYWYVQTIDTGLAKSNWSVMQNFTTTIDVTKPSVTINEPSPNESLHTTNPYFVFNATVTDANLTNVTLFVDFNGTMLANETNSSGINGTYVFIRNLTNYNDSMYSWYIEACDGNNNCQTSGRSFYLDRAYPVVRAISPANGGSWTSSNTVTFSYNVSDVDIANCSLIIDGNIVNVSTSVSENTEQNLTYSLSNGNYNWQVNCTDYVGYTNSSSIYSLTVSYTPPISSIGGGGGGGSTTTYKTYIINDEQLLQGYTQILSKNDKIKFSIADENHSLIVNSINETLNYTNLTLNSTPLSFLIYVNETKKFELTNDSFYDLLVKLNNLVENKANLTIKQIYEEISAEGKKEERKEGKEVGEEEKRKEEEKPSEVKRYLFFWVIGLIVIIVILVAYLKKYIKYRRWKKWTLLGQTR